MKNIWKKAAAFALALTLTAGAVPVQLRVLSGGTALVASATEESETFDTNTGEEIYTETHFKIEVDAPGDENGFYVNPDGINKATITALDEAVITKIVVVRGAGDDEPAIASETVEKTQDGDTFTFTNLNDTAVMLTG